jgi:hypothetical protein
MKPNFIAVLCVALVIPVAASANITVSSTLNFNFSNFSPAPVPSYGWGGNYYGSVNYYDSSTLSYSYPWSPNGILTLNTVYSDSRSGSWGSAQGDWDPSTGAGSLAFSALDNDAGPRVTMIGGGFSGSFYNLGPFMTLPEFSYTFNVSGNKDNENEQVVAAVQLELGYMWLDANNRWNENLLYSDYRSWVSDFRTNWVYEFSPVGDNDLSFAASGSRTFSNYSTSDATEHYWFLRYDQGAAGIADNGSGDVQVPEPATLVLLGLGLAGIAVMKRRITI